MNSMAYRLLLITSLIALMQSCVSSNPEIDKPLVIDQVIQEELARAKALENNKEAIQVLKKVALDGEFYTASDTLLSKVYHKLGHYSYQADYYKQAVSFLDTAIIIRTENPVHSLTDIAKSYYVRAVSYHQLSQNKKAVEDILEAVRNEEKYNKNSKNLGNYYSKAGLYLLYNGEEGTDSKDFLDQASKLLDPNSRDLAEHYHFLGEFYYYQLKDQLAKEYYEKAIAIFSQFPEEDNLYSIKFNLLEILCAGLNFKEAEKIRLNFLNEFEATNIYLKSLKEQCYNRLGLMSIGEGQIEASEKYYSKSLELANQLSTSGYSIPIARAYEGLGDVDEAKGNYQQSIENYHKAIQALCIGFDTKNPYAIPSLQNHAILDEGELERIMGFKADAVYGKYQASQEVADLEATVETYKAMDALLTGIRQGYKAAASRYQLIEKSLAMYEKATKIAIELFERTQNKKHLEQAFAFATKNKAVVLLDGLQDESAKFAGIPSELLEKEKELKKALYEVEGAIFDLSQEENKAPQALQKLIDQRFKNTRAYEDLIQDLEEQYPKYHELKYAKKQALNVEQIIRDLPANAAVIEYFVARENIYTFTITKESGLQYHIQSKPEDFGTRCIAFRKMLETDERVDMATFSEIASGLYDVVLKTVLEKIAEKETINRLFIIPDDHLMQVSFDPLLTEALDTTIVQEWLDDLPFLLKKYAISYAYSNQLLFEEVATQRIQKALEEYVGFGLEYDDYTLAAVQDMKLVKVDTVLTRGMGKLIHSDDEIVESAAIFDGKYYVNEQATKSRFMDKAPQAQCLHIAAHGFVIKEKPMNSGLIFTRPKQSSDFILKAADLYTMSLNADLAVLSACYTGDGSIQRGEGIRSLARAFNYAGCPNVTASLWAAPDLSTKKIMIPFYQAIKDGTPKDIALQKAKLNYLAYCTFNKEALPCNWAHLITIGNVEAVDW